ncbi:STN domain-containing protein [Stenotrophomonas sp. 24(2023)]|uniref:STN domain-containing protein n=1 Tax=Stenotrophomonas sp. 24(2023) TaxID=3068324 RepID=UPI0027DEDB3E|nr:STN domain-containing protein [Stenotrophomonas sp. 24(2023)]WMJ69409.1 STN domain-containing protein [Stenotrophomonas sp. 24(2023)]
MFNVRGLDGHHTRRSWRTAIAAWLLLCCAAVHGQDDAPRRFDLPAQPLEQAVERFSVISGWSVMYRGELAAGRTSQPVQDTLPPAQALQALLAGTGLDIAMAGPQRAVLHPAGAMVDPRDAPLAPLPDRERQRRYGQLQQQLRTAFCGDPMLAPGRYAATLAFQVDARGQVQAVELHEGTGDPGRDARLRAALLALPLGTDAAALPQPVLLHIQPRAGRHECAADRP